MLSLISRCIALKKELKEDKSPSVKKGANIKTAVFTDCFARQGYHGLDYVSSISNNATPLDPSWITDYRDAFDWLAKKRSLEKLTEMGITDLVETWKERGEV